MRVDILTLFPSMFDGPLDESILKRARQSGHLDLRIVNLRDFAKAPHRSVDDHPFGGGPGMVLKPEPIFAAIQSIQSNQSNDSNDSIQSNQSNDSIESNRSNESNESIDSIESNDSNESIQSIQSFHPRVIMLSPSGRRYDQSAAKALAKLDHLVLLCGNYEGFDERIREALVDEVISIGDYVLTNGSLPAMVLIDSVVRLLPGVLGDSKSLVEESFAEGLLEYPHYTRPADFRGMKVPEILLSGNHAQIAEWRRKMAEKRTAKFRPDLLRTFKNGNL